MKIGIVGNGGIVQQALHCLQEEKIEMTALWCRNGEKGKPLCDQYQLKLYTDYEAFLKDDSYDTVYIGLINSLHYEYAMKAVEAKKNVIVEKPFTSRYAEAVDLIRSYWGKMIDLGADTYYEAFMPEKPDFSPYGSPIVSSFCHAWACTPVYLLKKYL